MSALDDIVNSLPIDQLADRLGVSADQVREAANHAVPAILGGLDANAQDADGASSIAKALGKHTDDLGLDSGTVDLDRVDVADGEKIAGHIFGSNQDAVVAQLGGLGNGIGAKLIPMLAPIVLAYIAKQTIGGKSGSGAAGGGASGDLVSSVLSNILSGIGGGGGKGASSIITDLLGGLLGGGRR